MAAWKVQKRKVREAAWVLLQCMALLAILFTPIWIRPNPSGSVAERIRKLGHSGDGSGGAGRRPTSITSRVLVIPGPGFLKQSLGASEWSETLEAETRQIRFEWGLGIEPYQEWRLSSITRKNTEGSWEDVSLVWNEDGSPIGSVYIELAKGQNDFVAKMVSAKTKKTKKILLKVAQKR